MTQLVTIILAAGQGTRMHSAQAKVLHEVAGDPLFFYPLREATRLGSERVVCVLGHGMAEVQAVWAARGFKSQVPIDFVRQQTQLGTAHAVRQTEKILQGFTGDILILYGDVPLLQAATLKAFVRYHRKGSQVMSVLSMACEDPSGYGRIVRNADGAVSAIVEDLAATPAQREITEVNSGIYLIHKSRLFRELKKIKKNPRKGEYYLTDLVALLVQQGDTVGAWCAENADELMGVNTRLDLAQAGEWMRWRINEGWMKRGVTFLDPWSTYLDRSVQLNPDVTIGPGCVLRGQSKIQAHCVLETGCVVTDARLDQVDHRRGRPGR